MFIPLMVFDIYLYFVKFFLENENKQKKVIQFFCILLKNTRLVYRLIFQMITLLIL